MQPIADGFSGGKRQVIGATGQGMQNHSHNAAALCETAAAYIKRNERHKKS
jgi:hypothetical protein